MAVTAEDRWAEARHIVRNRWPYFQPLMIRMRFVPDNRIQTCGVNRKLVLVYNEAYINSLSLDEVVFALWHEINHVLSTFSYGELIPSPSFAHTLNIASDLEINSRARMERMKLPPNVYLPERYNFPPNRTTGEYLDLLQQNPPNENSEDCLGCGSCWVPSEIDEEISAEHGASEIEVEAARVSTARSVLEHATYGRAAGSLVEWAKAKLSPPSSVWKQLLRYSIQSHVSYRKGRDEATYGKPHRRAFIDRSSVILPGRLARDPDVSIAIDTSGSMSTDLLAESLGIVASILDQNQIQKVMLLQADAEVQSCEVVSRERLLQPFAVKGRGGTSFVPVIEKLEEERKTGMLLYFTDGYGQFPAKPPRFPVIWALIGTHCPSPPWGRTVRIQ